MSFSGGSESFLPLASSDSLGLTKAFVEPSFEMLSQLPELSADDMTSIERAVEIFEHMQPGGKEHLAALALMAQAHHAHGTYDKAAQVLDSMQPFFVEQDTIKQSLVRIATSKVLFTRGAFSDALRLTEQALETPELSRHPLHSASLLTSMALCQLLLCRDLQDAFSVRDHARVALRHVEQYAASPVARAAVQLNYGVSEAYFRQLVLDAHGSRDAPIDPALRAWRQGLTALQRSKRRHAAAALFLQSRLHYNMAWGLLTMNDTDRASNFAKESLAVFETWPSSAWRKEGLHRALALAAQCYHKAGSAVTAEGLFQSALDQVPVHPQEILELVESARRFADLMGEWEKRESQGKQYNERADTLESNLPENWKGRPVIAASLWFWTPEDVSSD